jgi:phosphoglucomutase
MSSSKTKFVGQVSITNSSDEAKFVPAGEVTGELDLTATDGMGVLKTTTVKTSPIEGQKPGTSGLRKKTKEFMKETTSTTLCRLPLMPSRSTVRISPKERLSLAATAVTSTRMPFRQFFKMGIANGVTRFWVGHNGLLSTPAVSAVIRERGPVWQKAFGTFVTSQVARTKTLAPKYNCENGGPAPEKLTNAIFENTKTIKSYKIAENFPTVDIANVGKLTVVADDNSAEVNVKSLIRPKLTSVSSRPSLTLMPSRPFLIATTFPWSTLP